VEEVAIIGIIYVFRCTMLPRGPHTIIDILND